MRRSDLSRRKAIVRLALISTLIICYAFIEPYWAQLAGFGGAGENTDYLFSTYLANGTRLTNRSADSVTPVYAGGCARRPLKNRTIVSRDLAGLVSCVWRWPNTWLILKRPPYENSYGLGALRTCSAPVTSIGSSWFERAHEGLNKISAAGSLVPRGASRPTCYPCVDGRRNDGGWGHAKASTTSGSGPEVQVQQAADRVVVEVPIPARLRAGPTHVPGAQKLSILGVDATGHSCSRGLQSLDAAAKCRAAACA